MCMGVLARKHSCANTTKMEQLNISRATSLTKTKAIGGRLYEERPSPISQLPASEPATSAGQSSGVTESAATLHSQTSCASPGQGSDHFSCLKFQHCHITLLKAGFEEIRLSQATSLHQACLWKAAR